MSDSEGFGLNRPKTHAAGVSNADQPHPSAVGSPLPLVAEAIPHVAGPAIRSASPLPSSARARTGQLFSGFPTGTALQPATRRQRVARMAAVCAANFASARRKHRHRRLQYPDPSAPQHTPPPPHRSTLSPSRTAWPSCRRSIWICAIRSWSRTPHSSALRISWRWSVKPQTAIPWNSRNCSKI